MDAKLFEIKFDQLCKDLNKIPSDDYLARYWLNVKGLTNEQFLRGYEWALDHCQFVPPPAEFLKAAIGDPFPLIWQQAMLLTQKLSSIRYDQNYSSKKAKLLSEVSPALVSFINESKVDILELGYMTDFNEINTIKKDLKKFIETQPLNDVYLNLPESKEQPQLNSTNKKQLAGINK